MEPYEYQLDFQKKIGYISRFEQIFSREIEEGSVDAPKLDSGFWGFVGHAISCIFYGTSAYEYITRVCIAKDRFMTINPEHKLAPKGTLEEIIFNLEDKDGPRDKGRLNNAQVNESIRRLRHEICFDSYFKYVDILRGDVEFEMSEEEPISLDDLKKAREYFNNEAREILDYLKQKAKELEEYISTRKKGFNTTEEKDSVKKYEILQKCIKDSEADITGLMGAMRAMRGKAKSESLKDALFEKFYEDSETRMRTANGRLESCARDIEKELSKRRECHAPRIYKLEEYLRSVDDIIHNPNKMLGLSQETIAKMKDKYEAKLRDKEQEIAAFKKMINDTYSLERVLGLDNPKPADTEPVLVS